MNPMIIAIREAFKGMRKGHGGPFGAVILKDGKVIAKAHNEVLKKTDATCHAEVMAIRKASKLLKRFDLSDCEIYSTCEPCPMCLSAIHWASIKKITYGCTRQDATDIGFQDAELYDMINGKQTKTEIKQENREECVKAFKEWHEKKDKTMY